MAFAPTRSFPGPIIDSPFRAAFSMDSSTDYNGGPRLYGIDPIQFYGEAYFPTIGRGLDIKLGRFFSQYGIEANDAPNNALFSHAYTFIYDPFTNTGLLATLKLTDSLSVQAGLVLGSDVFIDPADEPTFIGSVKWNAPEGRDSVQFSVIVGTGRYNQGRDFNNPDIFDLVYTHKINPTLNYSFETLFGFETNVTGIGTANWLGIVNYLTCQFTPQLSGSARLEIFDDAQGQRTGYEGIYTALTAGLSFRPMKSMNIRPELRYDYNNDSSPFEHKHGLFTAATDVIFALVRRLFQMNPPIPSAILTCPVTRRLRSHEGIVYGPAESIDSRGSLLWWRCRLDAGAESDDQAIRPARPCHAATRRLRAYRRRKH